MLQYEFILLIKENVKSVIDSLSNEHYRELNKITRLAESWGDTSFEDFGNVIKKNLDFYYCDSLDSYDEKNLEIYNEDINENEEVTFDFLLNFSAVTYSATSEGERLDFWFEFTFNFDNDGKLCSSLNMNI